VRATTGRARTGATRREWPAAGVGAAAHGHSSAMGDWRELLHDLPLESRLKALLVYELASDRVPGQPLEVTTAAVRAVARAEGLDTGQPWIEAAAARISAEPAGRPHA
jgi:hypothetical protein